MFSAAPIKSIVFLLSIDCDSGTLFLFVLSYRSSRWKVASPGKFCSLPTRAGPPIGIVPGWKSASEYSNLFAPRPSVPPSIEPRIGGLGFRFRSDEFPGYATTIVRLGLAPLGGCIMRPMRWRSKHSRDLLSADLQK